MSNEKSSSETSLAWKSLASAADANTEFHFKNKSALGEGKAQQTGLSDRLAQRICDGFLPLYFLNLAGLVLCSWSDRWSLLTLNVILAFLLTWLIRPILVSEGVVCRKRLALCALPVLAITWFGTILPETLIYLLRGGYWHLELLPYYLQLNIESSLLPSSLLFYLGLALAVAIASNLVQNRFYWIEVTKPGRKARLWRYCFWLVPPSFFVLVLWGDLATTRGERSWSDSLSVVYEGRKFAVLPIEGEDEYWRRLLKKSAPEFGEHYWEGLEDVAFQRPDDDSLESLALHPPTSGFELAACQKYYRILRSHVSDPEVHFAGVKLMFESRPRSSDMANMRLLLHSLAQAPVSGEALGTWKLRLQELNDLRMSREAELDLSAYQSLLRDKVYDTESFGNWSEDGFTYDRSYGAFSGRDLKVLGGTVPYSPSRLYFGWQRTRLRRAWLELKPTLLELTLDEQTERLHTLSEDTTRSSYARKFWKGLPYGNDIQIETRMLKTSALILALREHSLNKGELPETLSDLVDDAKAYTWVIEGEVGHLRDRHLGNRLIEVSGS